MALPKSIGLKLFDDSFVPVLTEGEVKNKKVILTTVKDNQKKAIIELYEGNSDKCINNEYLGKLVISIDRATNKGEPGLEVHLRLDENGMLYAKAWDVESGEETNIKIEHSKTKRIFQETLSDVEIGNLDSDTKKIDNYDSNQDVLIEEDDYYKKKNIFPVIRIILIVLIALVILSLLALGGYYLYKNREAIMSKFKSNTTTTTTIEEQETTTTTTTTLEKVTTTIKKEEVVVKDDEIKGVRKIEGKKHFIRRGDNLWNICKKYYGDPWYYPDLASVNNIKNPRLILAGKYLTIPPKSSLKRWDFSR